MKRNGRLIALGICAAIGAAFAVPSIVGADAPVPLARNSYAVSGYKVSPTGKQANSIVPTKANGKLPDRTDFKRYLGNDQGRERYWRQAMAESSRLGDEFLELVESGHLAERLQPL